MAPIRCCFDQTAVWHSDAARGPSTPSFNHLVGAREQRWRNVEVNCLRSSKIDHQIELRRHLDRKVGWRGALENPADVDAHAAISIGYAGPIAHQAADLGIIPRRIAREQRVAS